jgi:AAHS family 4-hydroxybenzoate transporter-like MFS transporter
MASKDITIQSVFDSVPRVSSYQYWICTICFLVVFLESFDQTIIGVTVPKIADFLHTTPGALGYAMSASLAGSIVGAVVLGMLADRFGRKWMLFLCAVLFGLFTLLTIFITNVGQLALFRFIAGIGIGGAVPNAVAFGSEYAPSRLRKTFAATMYAGAPVGATLAGLVAAYFIPHYGWQSLFLLGGIVPLIIALITLGFLPESLEFLASKSKNQQRIRKTVLRVAPAIGKDQDYRFTTSEVKLPGVPAKHLFTGGRALTTILLWIAMAGGLYLLYVLVSWAPTLLHKSGATVVQYSIAFAALNFGAAISFVSVGRLMDMGNPFRILQVAYILSFLSLVVFGLLAGGSLLTVAAISVVCGFFVNGSFAGLLAIATVSYPSDIRGTAIGWAYAIAKFGGMLAPVVGGFLLTLGWTVRGICGVNALVALLVALVILILGGRVAAYVTSPKRQAA